MSPQGYAHKRMWYRPDVSYICLNIVRSVTRGEDKHNNVSGDTPGTGFCLAFMIQTEDVVLREGWESPDGTRKEWGAEAISLYILLREDTLPFFLYPWVVPCLPEHSSTSANTLPLFVCVHSWLQRC